MSDKVIKIHQPSQDDVLVLCCPECGSTQFYLLLDNPTQEAGIIGFMCECGIEGCFDEVIYEEENENP